jgi:hypothetical protein
MKACSLNAGFSIPLSRLRIKKKAWQPLSRNANPPSRIVKEALINSSFPRPRERRDGAIAVLKNALGQN